MKIKFNFFSTILFGFVLVFYLAQELAPIYELDDCNLNNQWYLFKIKFNRNYSDSKNDQYMLVYIFLKIKLII